MTRDRVAPLTGPGPARCPRARRPARYLADEGRDVSPGHAVKNAAARQATDRGPRLGGG
jgi:hypothetical protein